MLLRRWESDGTDDSSKNAAIGTDSKHSAAAFQGRRAQKQLPIDGTPFARPAHPSATCTFASTVSTCGTGTAGIRAGAPRHAPGLNPSLTSLKMVRRFCAITFTHAIFPIIGK